MKHSSRPFVHRPGWLALLALLVSGCVSGPRYQAPASALRPQLEGVALLDQRPGQAPAPTLDAWWLGFQDPTLTEIVERALGQNLDLAAAMARVAQARAAAQGASAARMPRVDATGQLVAQSQSLLSPEGELGRRQPGYDRQQVLQQVGVGASWETDLAGGLQRGSEAASYELQAAEAGRTGVRISVVADAADAYFRIRGAQLRLAVANEQIAIQQNLQALVTDRLRGGLATQREEAQARALALQARATLPPLRTELALQLNRLDVLMGAQPGTYAGHLAGRPAQYRVPAIHADITSAELLRRRPDVIAAERRLAASNARIGVAMAEYYPSVSLGGMLGFDSLHGALLGSDAFQPRAVLGLRWRLFDFGRIDAEIAQARGANAQALAAYRLAMLRAAEEVENAIVVLGELEAQRIDVDDEVAARRVARAAAQDAYRSGAVSLIEVLAEDRQLLASRDQLALLEASDARAAVATFRALGGGWAANGPPSATARTSR